MHKFHNNIIFIIKTIDDIYPTSAECTSTDRNLQLGTCSSDNIAKARITTKLRYRSSPQCRS